MSYQVIVLNGGSSSGKSRLARDLQDVLAAAPPTDPVPLTLETVLSLPDRLRELQPGFSRTGGLHAAGLFTTDGAPVGVREDVGRHNAVDKLVGWAAREDRLPLSGCVLLVSGRTSFELAENAGMTLVGFLRGTTMNAYARPDRLDG